MTAPYVPYRPGFGQPTASPGRVSTGLPSAPVYGAGAPGAMSGQSFGSPGAYAGGAALSPIGQQVVARVLGTGMFSPPAGGGLFATGGRPSFLQNPDDPNDPTTGNPGSRGGGGTNQGSGGDPGNGNGSGGTVTTPVPGDDKKPPPKYIPLPPDSPYAGNASMYGSPWGFGYADTRRFFGG